MSAGETTIEIVTFTAGESGWGIGVDGEWALAGPASASGLSVTPSGPVEADGHGLCQVTGAGEAAHPGLRSRVTVPPDGESLRLAHAWLPAGEDEDPVGLALGARRPRRARGHDRDQLTAAVLGPAAAPAVVDPRLSVTLDGSGAPLRIGLELWLAGEGEDEVLGYPWRAAGEVRGENLELVHGALLVRAWPVRWRSRSRAGAGVYVLAAPR